MSPQNLPFAVPSPSTYPHAGGAVLIMSRILVLFLGAFLALAGISPAKAQVTKAQATWQQQLQRELPLLGHRNWILIVDSAYPLQTSPGVETLETNTSQTDVVREVLKQLSGSPHVRPTVFMDAELPFVTEADAPGIGRYKEEIAAILSGQQITSLRHEEIISKIDEAGRAFHVLVLKTTLTLPYTSVFLQLNCKYWSDAAEKTLRSKLK